MDEERDTESSAKPVNFVEALATAYINEYPEETRTTLLSCLEGEPENPSELARATLALYRRAPSLAMEVIREAVVHQNDAVANVFIKQTRETAREGRPGVKDVAGLVQLLARGIRGVSDIQTDGRLASVFSYVCGSGSESCAAVYKQSLQKVPGFSEDTEREEQRQMIINRNLRITEAYLSVEIAQGLARLQDSLPDE